MIKQLLRNKLIIAGIMLAAVTLFSSQDAFAWGGRGHYYYRGGHWQSRGWFWGGFATGLVIGSIVATLPPHYEVIYVHGLPYYYYDDVYYRPCPSGYIVVPEPTTTIVTTVPAGSVIAVPSPTQPYAASGVTVVINVPNTSGGYTPVTLTRYKTGYIGPQGEYYEGHPTVEQLKALYGR